MDISEFISVGENIHCTRIYKVGGRFVKPADNGEHVIVYQSGHDTRHLPVPPPFTEHADWQSGKVKHCAVAIWQGNYGESEADKAAGIDYLQSLARRQEATGASYLDINVDEFSTDVEERSTLMRWTVDKVQQSVAIPMSIDSSNTDILRAGLEACDPSRGRPMINSVSLERAEAVGIASEFNAVVIASAAGEKGLPSTLDERLANLEALMPRLAEAGLDRPAIHVDPLVFPISVDGSNGKNFLDAVAGVRATYGAEIHVVAGLSNVSFGMPKRKLINQVFTHMAVEAGADGGIVDPLQINLDVLRALDVESEGYRLAKALLLGEDEFGMNYITACREGKV
jgi:5-methyltetrahydrofolate--homocysteine methyltransferase